MRAAGLALLVLLAGCDAPEEPATLPGYVEAEDVIVAAPEAGWVERVEVREGDAVEPGTVLFRLDTTDQAARLADVQARLAEARARLADLLTGKRPEEIRELEAQLARVRAEEAFAQAETTRAERLVKSRAGDRRSLEQATMSLGTARARIAELEASLDLARLPARADQIEAQRAAVAALEAQLRQAQWELDERVVVSRVTARVEQLVRFAGERAPAGGAVLRLLPPDALKVRFFVPQGRLAELAPGKPVAVTCDGCPPGLSATLGFVADEVEFTPPVIYSLEARAKLVVMAEARLPAGTVPRPGQPVEVRLP